MKSNAFTSLRLLPNPSLKRGAKGSMLYVADYLIEM
jgi:hypothetical protein